MSSTSDSSQPPPASDLTPPATGGDDRSPAHTIGAESFAIEQSERELNARERIALQALLDGASYSEASRRAGYSSVTQVSDKLGNGASTATPTFRQAFLRACEARGLTADLMVAKAMRNLDAKAYALSKAGEVVELGLDAHASVKQWDSLAKAAGMYPDPRLEARLELNAQVVVLPPEYGSLGGVSLFGAAVVDGASEPVPALPEGVPDTTPTE